MPMERRGIPALTAAVLVLVFAVKRPAALPQAVPPPAPIRVLLLSGQNNHDWRSTTPKLVEILRESGKFAVRVTDDPASLTPEELASQDVLLSNWNAFGLDPKTAAWPKRVQRAYLDFVKRGRGHVVVHAGSASFPDWAAYGRLTLATWKKGQTSHGPIHEFPVRIERTAHPVTEGIEPFTIRDELWNGPGLAEGAEVLASSFSGTAQGGTGQWEPSVLAGRFGEGRSLTILLGHDAAAMDNLGFKTLLTRAVEWAATGRVSASRPAWPAGPWHWEKTPGSSLALAGPAGPLWEFRYADDLDVPYFHPLRTIDGRLLTWDRPPDHLWHHGLWFSWKFINKTNYWEIDAATGHPEGRTSWSNVRVTAGRDFRARIDMDLAYARAGVRTPVLLERRTIEISPPDAGGVYTLDWTCAFKAVSMAFLDRTPLPGEIGGQTWGGYAGLSLRLAQGLDERRAMTSEGPIETWTEDRYRGRHAALDYSGLVDGEPAGVAILDDPRNPRSPSPWYVIRSAEMSFFTPAVLCFQPLTLRAGDVIVLRYRVIVHHGRFDEARLKSEAARFSGPASGSSKR
jgi:type 1 glutamine amidotransferase